MFTRVRDVGVHDGRGRGVHGDARQEEGAVGKVKRDLTFAIDPSLYTHVKGTTDSEVLFHLAITFGLVDDPVKALTAVVDHVERVCREHGILFPMQGTIAVADGSPIDRPCVPPTALRGIGGGEPGARSGVAIAAS